MEIDFLVLYFLVVPEIHEIEMYNLSVSFFTGFLYLIAGSHVALSSSKSESSFSILSLELKFSLLAASDSSV